MRRPALLQVLGILVAENGVYLLAISVPGGLPFVIELGVLFDLVLVVTVAAAFTQQDPRRARHRRHRPPAGAA